ncbi:hypothetical protein [Coleofasciculus sp.]|uniref:hypothetical protein n=1 Tax=Coleofasciculus sp. TaxID=3100458 RepID=UPI003A183366
MKKQERNRLIKRISLASGVAQYALQKKMTDEQISQAAQHLDVLELVKPANNYNRYCQAQKTREANEKLKSFLDPNNSEIVSAGKWLINALSNNKSERHQALLERDLVHKEDYNTMVSDMRQTISDMDQMTFESTQESGDKIRILEKRIDSLKGQLSSIEEYIRNNHGVSEWKRIKETLISKSR